MFRVVLDLVQVVEGNGDLDREDEDVDQILLKTCLLAALRREVILTTLKLGKNF